MSDQKPNLASILKTAKEMQANMEKAQKELDDTIFSGNADTWVEIKMNGKHEVESVQLNPELLTQEKDVVEELISNALSDVLQKIHQASKEQILSIAENVDMPNDEEEN